MKKKFEERIQKAEHGEKIFSNMFETSTLTMDDTFVMLLTENADFIYFGVKYLPDFIKTYQRKNVYILLSDVRYAEAFSGAGGIIKYLSNQELQDLAEYFSLFHKKEYFDNRLIFFMEKDGYGFFIEELLERGEFSLEEYVSVSLFRLKI